MKKHSIKLTALVLALVLTAALALTGCGSKSDDSDGATTIQIAVPNDTTNEARALLLLEAQGLIKLKEGITFTATVLDIAENPKNLSIKEIEAAQLARSLQDVDAAVINGNYAIQRPFVLVTKTGETLSPAAQAFFDYATSSAASQLIKAAGAVPVAK